MQELYLVTSLGRRNYNYYNRKDRTLAVFFIFASSMENKS